MRFRNTGDLKYLAGVMDEKVHFYILPTGNIQVSLRSRGRLPVSLKKEFGGSVFRNGPLKRFWYKVQGRKAAHLLEAVLPYLKNEAKNARSILDSWQEHKQRGK